MGNRPNRFVVIVIVASVLIALPQEVYSVINGQNLSDTEKVNWAVNYFQSHEQLARGVYESVMAAEDLVGHISMGNMSTSSIALTNATVRYWLKTMPDLLRNPVFQGIVAVNADEAGKAYQQSGLTIASDKPITDEDFQKIVSKFNLVSAATRSITKAKPLIDQYLHVNDSTLLVMVLNNAIEAAASGAVNPTAQAVMNIVIKELSEGFKKSNVLERITKGGPGFLNDINNAASVVSSVIMSTNLQRLLSKSYNISKPILDNLYHGDTQVIYDSLLQAIVSANSLQQNPTFQFLYKTFGSQLLKTSNATGQSNAAANTLMKVLQNTSLRSVIELVLGSVSSRIVLPYNSSAEEDTISSDCYEDMIDFLDAAKQEKVWALKRLDSFGKIPSGLAKGNINFLGSYDECLAITSDIKAGDILGGVFRKSPRYPRSVGSRYCRVRIPIPANILDGLGVDTKGIPLRVTLGTCVPNTCTGKDVYGLLKLDAFNNATSLVESVDCSLDMDITQDLGAVLTIILLSIFAFLILTGTLYVSMESRGVFANNDKSDNADSAYSNLTFTKIDENKLYPTLNDVKVENGHPSKDPGEGKKGTSLPASYVPHAESADKHVNETADHPNGVSNGKTNGTKTVSPTQGANTRPSGQKKEGVLVRIVKAFSVQINAPKILTGKTGLNSVQCIHGIKFFSITWVMLGHTYNYGILSEASTTWTAVNFVDAFSMIQRFTFQAVIAGGFSVDTFFMISGMLLAYIQLKQMAKLKAHPTGPKIGNYVLRYFFHRFWRLTPMYAVVLLIFATLLPYIGKGPLWPNVIQTSENCKDSWWTNLLYINNLVKVDGQCMGWTWFLSNDMQFYVVSIFLLSFMTMSLPLGLVINTLLLLVGTSIATWQEYVYNGNFFTMKSDDGNYWSKVYVTPWCRVGAYCVGLFLGVIFYKRPRKAFSKTIGFIGWTIATAVALTLVYSTYSTNKKDGTVWTNAQNAFYEGFGRPVWSICVAWVIFACHNDMGGYVNSILSWKSLVPLSRLSYAAYLIHPMMMIIHVFSKRSLVYLTDYDMIYLFVGHATISYMGAFILSVACEAPFMALEKLIL